MKRGLSVLLLLALLCSLFAAAIATPAAGAGSPSAAVYVNGQWVSAKYLYGSGAQWIEFPIAKSSLKNGTVNYIRITSNADNGDTENTQISIGMSYSSETNTYSTPHQWLDDGYSAEAGRNADFNLEGWDGSKWVCVHSGSAYSADATEVLGKKADGTYQGFARNLELAAGTTEKYSNFRILALLYIGSELTVNPDNEPLFPYENYHACTFCSECGGCLNPSCTLNHVPCGKTESGHHCTMCPICGKCTCTAPECDCTHEKCVCGQTSQYGAAIRARFNGKWYGVYLADAALSGQWVYIPVEMGTLSEGSISYTAVTSNVALSDTAKLKIWSTSASGGLESYESSDRYCDNGWTLCSGKNINIKVEGWNGTKWIDLNAASPAYSTDSAGDLGCGSDGAWSVACRNITLGSVEGIKYVRVGVQLSADAGLFAVADYAPETFASFLNPKLASDHPEQSEDPVGQHKTSPDTPAAAATTTGSKSGASLQIRVNGTSWYETALDSVTVDSNGIGWAAVYVPISALRSNGENQFLLTSNITNGKEYSGNSVDIFATAVASGTSFKNVNDYYDDWSLYSGYEWNMKLQAAADGSWTTLSDHPDTYYDAHRLLGKTADGAGSYAARNVVTGDLSSYTQARVLVQIHIGEYLNAAGISYEHKTAPDTPKTGRPSGSREGARLQVRVNGTSWYETPLDNISTDANDVAWVSIDLPAGALRSNAENQFLLTSNVTNGAAYSGNSIDLFATAGDGNSFKNVNDYYDDWTYYENYGWNVQLQASADGKDWTVLSGNPEGWYDASRPLGKLATGKGSYAARNVVTGDLSEYKQFRLLVQVHIGKYLQADSSQNVVIDHVTTAPAEGALQHSGSRSGALLYVRVNGKWTWISLNDYAGKTGWVNCPIDIRDLNANVENYFNVATNVVSYGVNTASSVDIFSTSAKEAAAYYTYDPYCDNDWATLPGQYMDIRLELYNGKEWVESPASGQYFYDNAYNLGKNGESRKMAAGRNLVIGDLTGYTKARVSVLMHVGTSLNFYDSPIDGIYVHHPNKIEEEAPAAAVTDSKNILLYVRVNGTWFEQNLEEYKGQDGVWVPVPIEGSFLNAGVENYFSVTTNAASYGEHSGSSVDLYYSNAGDDLNSFRTDDEYCDTGFERYDDRVINLRLEGFNGKEWVTVAPTAKSYTDGCGLLGFNAETEEYSNYARNIILGSLDKYTEFRVCVQLHVGGTLALLDDLGGTGSAFDRSRDVGKPAPAGAPGKTDATDATDGTETDAADEASSGTLPWWPFVAGGVTLSGAGAAMLLYLRKKHKKEQE